MKCWNLQKAHNTILSVAIASSACFLTGCSSPEINQAIVTFGGDVAIATKALDTFYKKINSLERQEYLKQLKYQKDVPISANKDLPGGGTIPTGLFDQYSPDQILARRKCLEALAKYTGNLALLASSDAPKRTAAELEQLKSPIYDIGTQLATIKGRNTKQIASDIQTFAGPVAGLASLIGEAWVAKIQDDAIVKCATNASPRVKEACESLYGDADNLLSTYNSHIGVTLRIESKAYGLETDPKIKADILNDVKTSAEAYSAMSNICPSKLIQDLFTVHEDLVACLNASVFSNSPPSYFKPVTIISTLSSSSSKTEEEDSAKAPAQKKKKKTQKSSKLSPPAADKDNDHDQVDLDKPRELKTRDELIAKALADLAQFDSECKAMAAAVNEITDTKTTQDKKAD